MSQILKVLAIFCMMALTSLPLAANPLSDFNAKVSEAYSGYRAAMNYLRTGNPGLASLELSAAVDGWQAVERTYMSDPPAEFVKDDTFAATLSNVGKALNSGLDKSADGDMETAQEVLLPVRGMLYALRQRNGVRAYADCITDMNTVMDRLYRVPPTRARAWHIRRCPAPPSQPIPAPIKSCCLPVAPWRPLPSIAILNLCDCSMGRKARWRR